MRSKRAAYVTAIFYLAVGLLIYVLFRGQGAPIRDAVGFDATRLRSVTPDWIVWWLPDGLWILAFTTALLATWDFKLNRQALFWMSILLITGIGLEVLQISGAVSGTFDPVDLVFITVGAFLPVALCRWTHDVHARALKRIGQFRIRNEC